MTGWVVYLAFGGTSLMRVVLWLVYALQMGMGWLASTESFCLHGFLRSYPVSNGG